MNKRFVIFMTGNIMLFEAALMVLPMIVCLIYSEHSIFSFTISALVAVAIGLAFIFLSKPKTKDFFVKEGFAVVALSWTLMSLVGALPFTISGEIPSYIDALFETVSGFTTTGASILTNVEALSHGMLFWRSFTHWIGGMGVLVFVMAILPSDSGRSIHIMRAEMPGPVVGKLVPKAKTTAKILCLIYIVLTAVEVVMLACGGMNLFESLLHSFGTAGTGGFGIKADSLAGYSPYIQWVITAFMLIFGINFNLFFLVIVGKPLSAVKSRELWCYIAIVIIAIVLISFNINSMYGSISETIRVSSFQVASIITTTGYSTVDFNLWPEFSKSILIILMFIGGCAGSTAGGLKVSRVMLLFKMMKKDLKKTFNPRAVNVVRFEGKRVDDVTLSNTSSYFIIYTIIFAAVCLVISFEPFDFETAFTATLACLNNIGPGLSSVGPASSFASYSWFAKIILTLTMLFGRLEIYPMLFAFSFRTWQNR